MITLDNQERKAFDCCLQGKRSGRPKMMWRRTFTVETATVLKNGIRFKAFINVFCNHELQQDKMIDYLTLKASASF